MRICIDSSLLIRGLRTEDATLDALIGQVGYSLKLTIPRLLALEVTRSLTTPTQIRLFYSLFQNFDFATIIDEPVPPYLVDRYTSLGIRTRADAFVAAFVEWQQIDYLITDSRPFLRLLQTPAYTVIDPDTFMTIWQYLD